MKTTSYARARLTIGILGVGTLVVLAAALLATQAPSLWLHGRGGSPVSDAIALLVCLALGSAVLLPFEIAGGQVLPARFGRPAPGFAGFFTAWTRGVLVTSTLAAASGVLLLVAGRTGGRPAALAAFLLLGLVFIALQEPIARLTGGLRRVQPTPESQASTGAGPVRILRARDPGFTGGLTGLAPVPVLPADWIDLLSPAELTLVMKRRRQLLESGAWRRTLIAAVAWNALGFLLASLLPGAGFDSVAALVTTALGFHLWTFAGLLLLPAPSRRATLSADAAVADTDESRAVLLSALQHLDRLQDDEPNRSPQIESVFHPIPSLEGRRRALMSPEPTPPGAWHLARTALYLAYPGLSLLPRAVHCNAGRPELWIHLPADG